MLQIVVTTCNVALTRSSTNCIGYVVIHGAHTILLAFHSVLRCERIVHRVLLRREVLHLRRLIADSTYPFPVNRSKPLGYHADSWLCHATIRISHHNVTLIELLHLHESLVLLFLRLTLLLFTRQTTAATSVVINVRVCN